MVATDIAGVAAIENESPSPWAAKSLQEELAVPQGIQLVAESAAGQILGWCACRVISPEGELLKIAVGKKHRECGVGHRLLEHLCSELKHRKVTSLFLEVRSNNRTAIRFYKNHGFLNVGTRPGYYTDPPDLAIILHKRLSL